MKWWFSSTQHSEDYTCNTLSNFKPSSKTKIWINCSEFRRVSPRPERNWPCSVWRKDGFGGTQQQPASAYRKTVAKIEPNSSVMVAGRQETMSLKLKERFRHKGETFSQHSKALARHAQKYYAVPILGDLQGIKLRATSCDLGAEAALSGRLN